MASQRPQKKRSKSQTSDQVRRTKVRATPAVASSPALETVQPPPPATTPVSAAQAPDTSVVAEKGGVPVGRGEREQPLSSVELVSLVGALGLILTLMLMVIVAA